MFFLLSCLSSPLVSSAIWRPWIRPGRWVALRRRWSGLGMRGVTAIPVPSLPRFLGRIFRLVLSRMVPSRLMAVPTISMCAGGMRPCRAMVSVARMCLSMAARFWSGEPLLGMIVPPMVGAWAARAINRIYWEGDCVLMVYQFSRFDRESNRELWRYHSPVSLRVEWLAAWLKREHAARFGYRAWLYVQVSSGDMITRDLLSWRDEIEA